MLDKNWKPIWKGTNSSRANKLLFISALQIISFIDTFQLSLVKPVLGLLHVNFDFQIKTSFDHSERIAMIDRSMNFNVIWN
ncbi:hypothetical protein QE152_g1720 [Popillia japonica]|uniref:Uncharacterized protein n=1 Tax=Popillia japonica TaxID=7064 RepID=A0AAW1N7D7_POPJA